MKQWLLFHESFLPDWNRKLVEEVSRLVRALENPKRIGFFAGLASEPQLLDLLDRHTESQWYLPRITSQDEGTMEFAPVSSKDELKTGPFGIAEPIQENFSGTLDLLLVPGLAFDLQGGRLGKGKAFYDRYLKRTSPSRRVGVSFAGQVFERVPTTITDEPVDGLCTEDGFLETSPRVHIRSQL